MPTAEQQINQLTSSHIALLDAQVEGFSEAIVKIADGLRDMIQNVVPQLDEDNRTMLLRQTVHLQSQIRGQLTQIGYDDIIEDFISGYDEEALYGRQVLRLLGRPDQILSPMRQDTLLHLKNLDLSAFNEIGTRAVRELSKQLTLNVLAGKSRADVIRAMDEVLDGQFVNQGVKYADTAVRVYDRTVNGSLWLESEIWAYKYFGPNDNKTRQFCRSLVGKTYNINMIRMMNNGTSLGDPWTYGGGPRCRHVFVPVVD